MDVLTSIAASYLNRHWYGPSAEAGVEPVMPVLLRLATAGASLAVFLLILGIAGSP